MATRAISMTLQFVAWDTSANAGKTGDSANFTMRWVKDGTSAAPTNSPTQVDATNAPGVYSLTITATEADCNIGTLCGKSATANISIIPITIQFERLPDAAPAASGGLLTFGSSTGQLNVSGGKAPATLASTDVTGNVSADVQTIKTEAVTCSAPVTVEAFVGTSTAAIAVDGSGHVTAGTVSDKTGYSLTSAYDAAKNAASASALSTLTAIFSGITSLAQWLGLMAGKQTPDATALSEIKATGAGSGTYDATTDSQEALRDEGDAAWITATAVTVSDKTGFSLTTAYDAAKTAAAAGDQMDLVNAPNATAITAIQNGLATSSALSTLSTKIGTPAGATIAADIATNLAKWTTAITESYATDGSAPTPEQAMMMILQSLHEFAISGTTRTVKKLDGSATAMTFTLDDATNPTSTTRAS